LAKAFPGIINAIGEIIEKKSTSREEKRRREILPKKKA